MDQMRTKYVDEEEVMKDISKINLIICQKVVDKLSNEWDSNATNKTRDTITLVDSPVHFIFI